ncbi:DUF4272 domain-containing protein [Polluticaenibacter yanchengensis]|uniref:DUF4272 domain-containing protein n=1 Tax=Polluticaenibacter yanchengensis TaxID=3014562 RepID=A0ABT4ULK6_9BACT|nr:DUF4272 domain-containing protein [Chitinophagaceae bacterium LY-5]
MICTIYTHYLAYEKLISNINNSFPKAKIDVNSDNDSKYITVVLKGGLFSGNKEFKINYRERGIASYQIVEVDNSPLAENIKGLYGYVNSLPVKNPKIKSLLLHKIVTLNTEFTISNEKNDIKELPELVKNLVSELDAIVFAQPNTSISKSDSQHFLDKNLDLITDLQGNSAIEELEVKISPEFYDGKQAEITNRQKARKYESEDVAINNKIKVNSHLPYIEDDNEVELRSAKAIAERVCVLAVTNFVAFDSLSGKEAIDYLKKYDLWQYVTPNERDFLENPTTEKKNQETWKCECIWTLMWALGKVEDLGFPDELCQLQEIPEDEYPVQAGKDPNDFINSVTESRSVKEILDANDLYYRLDWACVDARLNNQEITAVNPGVVYERHYALNWLINYMNEDWDDVTCDT